jgi:hypothetical protein
MSRVLSTKITFPASASTDVVGYKLYLELAPQPVTYESQSFELGYKTEVIISTLPGVDQLDGVYNIGVTAVDEAGNESEFKLLNDVALDFYAPDPPGDLALVRD